MLTDLFVVHVPEWELQAGGNGSVSLAGTELRVQSEVGLLCAVEGGQRAIVFNRIGGMQMDTVLAEGLHFRYESTPTLLP